MARLQRSYDMVRIGIVGKVGSWASTNAASRQSAKNPGKTTSIDALKLPEGGRRGGEAVWTEKGLDQRGRTIQYASGYIKGEYDRLRAELEQAYLDCKLPEAPGGAAEERFNIRFPPDFRDLCLTSKTTHSGSTSGGRNQLICPTLLLSLAGPNEDRARRLSFRAPFQK